MNHAGELSTITRRTTEVMRGNLLQVTGATEATITVINYADEPSTTENNTGNQKKKKREPWLRQKGELTADSWLPELPLPTGNVQKELQITEIPIPKPVESSRFPVLILLEYITTVLNESQSRSTKGQPRMGYTCSNNSSASSSQSRAQGARGPNF
jgi:hypothetical protein